MPRLAFTAVPLTQYSSLVPTLRLLALVLLLASLDLAGTIALKEASLRRSPILAMCGVLVFVVLALVLYAVLETAELTLVSLGWVVVLQVAVCVVDALVYGWRPGTVQVVAVAVALLALIVAAVAPNASPDAEHDVEQVTQAPEARVPQQRIAGRHVERP